MLIASTMVLALCTGCGGKSSSSSGGATSPQKSLLQNCPAIPASTAPAGSLAAIVDALVTADIKSEGLPGMSIAIAKNGEILYAQGYGYADLTTCKPVLPDTPYSIGSVTKQFTATAILQLQQSGLVNIDNPIGTYLTGYNFDPHITLRMLLNQTSGLPDYLNFPAPPDALNGLQEPLVLSAIAQNPLLFTPGSAYAYSNSNYFILGSIVEAVTGRSYADYLASQVFQPAGLIQTSYLKPADAAAPYTYDNPLTPGTTGLATGILPDSSVYFAAGALWSTVTDLTKWNAALFNDKIISSQQFSEMVTPPAGVPDFQQAGVPSYYAMGWVRANTGGHPLIWHNGGTFAYTAFNGMFLDDGFSISILTNVDHANAEQGTPMLPFAVSIVEAICSNSATASNC
jgi:CubicO group peptidase (beta-lactamase class C family)